MDLTSSEHDRLRFKDKKLLHYINDGLTGLRELNKKTEFSSREIGYMFNKISDSGYINSETPDGYVEDYVDGQKLKFRAPRQAEITEKGESALELVDIPETKYEDMTRGELFNYLQELEESVKDLHAATQMILSSGPETKAIDQIEGKIEDMVIDEVRKRIEREAGHCFICDDDNPEVLQTHHVLPRRFGRSDDAENLVTLCANCHQAIEKIYDDAFFSRAGIKDAEPDSEVSPTVSD